MGLLLGAERHATAAIGIAILVARSGPAWFALWRRAAGGRFEGVANVRIQALSVASAILLVLPLHFWLRMQGGICGGPLSAWD